MCAMIESFVSVLDPSGTARYQRERRFVGSIATSHALGKYVRAAALRGPVASLKKLSPVLVGFDSASLS